MRRFSIANCRFAIEKQISPFLELQFLDREDLKIGNRKSG